MNRTFIALVTVLTLATMTVPVLAAGFAGEQIVMVQTDSQAEVNRLADLGFDICTVTKSGGVHLVVDQTDASRLNKEGFTFQPLNDDSTALRAQFTVKGKTAADAGAYHTYAETNALLKEWATKFPALVKLENIGKTFEKRDVYAVRITAAPAGKKVPKLLIQGLHHSREWIAVEVPLAFGQMLIDGYATDAKIKKLLETREVWIVPIVNPDGHVWSQTQYSYWRKNRNDNNGNSSKGVDPNRNYGYQWGNVGASNSPSSDTYHGTGPFSEPCTQNIKKLADREKFTADITHHAYGELILYPWSYAYNQPCEDLDTFKQLANGMAKFNGHDPKESCDLYPSMGDTTDYMYGATRSLSFTYEVARRFIPGENEIAGICEKNNKAQLYLLEAIGTIHAKNHPDHVTPLRFEAARLAHLTAVAEHLKSTGKDTQVLDGVLVEMKNVRLAIQNLLTADEDGTVCRDLLALATEKKPAERTALLPVLEDLKARYIQELTEGRGLRSLDKRIDAINALIPQE